MTAQQADLRRDANQIQGATDFVESAQQDRALYVRVAPDALTRQANQTLQPPDESSQDETTRKRRGLSHRKGRSQDKNAWRKRQGGQL